MAASRSEIVVGVDGSPCSVRALRWALAQAALTGARLHVVHAWHVHAGEGVVAEIPRSPTSGFMPAPTRSLLEAEHDVEEALLEAAKQRAEAIRAAREHEAEQLVEAAVAKATGGDPVPVEIEPEVLEGHAGEVLVERGRNADLLVVGCRGHGELRQAVLGSVSHHCLRHALCPVVVVPHDIWARSIPLPSSREQAAAGR